MNPNNLLNTYDRYMQLNIYTETPELYDYYVTAAIKHNAALFTPQMGPNSNIDAGFDLIAPVGYLQIKSSQSTEYLANSMIKIDFNIACSAQMVIDGKSFNTGYYMYPRSSLSKTHLRLANSTGIIDAGYRGHIMGVFDEIREPSSYISSQNRLVQVCAPGLVPIYVTIVNNKCELGEPTTRGEGGFGSTGSSGVKEI
jgi:dUTPase